jgi:hypothetical protein
VTGEAKDVGLTDARALLEAASAFVRFSAAREKAQERVLLLARRLTQDWRLTDEEAVREAGELALGLVLKETRDEDREGEPRGPEPRGADNGR